MIKTVIIIIVVVIAAILIYAATRPNSFRVQRTRVIKAPPERIFPLIDDLHQWEAWSPWEKIDPEIKRTYSGSANGKGAVYEWSGNKDIGQGRIEIIESLPPAKIVLKIDFISPFEAHNILEFTIESKGGDTTTTQAMFGPSPYLSKLMGIFCSMDRMVGSKFEDGLASLKAIAEK